VKRTRQRRQPIQVQYLRQVPPPDAPVTSLDGIQWMGIDEALQPHLHTITDLVNKHVHLNVQDPHQAQCSFVRSKLAKGEADSSHASATTTVNDDVKSVKDAAGHLVPEDRDAAVAHDPWVTELFRSKLQQLPVPDYYFHDPTETNTTADDIYALLRRKQQQVELFDFAYEQLQLGEAGTFFVQPKAQQAARAVTFPPCSRGSACCGMLNGIPDPDKIGTFVMTQMMYRHEYHTLMFSAGAAPPPARPCILCCRRLLVDWVTWNRTITMTSEVLAPDSGDNDAYTAQTASQLHANSHIAPVYQLFRNLVNEPNGYFSQYVLTPREGDAIIDPICMFVLPVLKRVAWPVSTTATRRYIDQSLMQWKPTVHSTPRLGESIQNFCSGVGGPQRAQPMLPAAVSSGGRRPSTSSARPPLHHGSAYSATPAV
jgi:hypothetical protein